MNIENDSKKETRNSFINDDSEFTLLTHILNE